jgi:hypothetical protein
MIAATAPTTSHQSGGQDPHAGHAGHGSHAEIFRRRFWLSLFLTVPIVVTDGVVCVALPVVVLVVETPVTKNSSVPTLSTAF